MMYAEKLFRHYKKSTGDMQLVLKPCPVSISKSYLKNQKKRGLSQVEFTNEALMLAASLFLTQSNLTHLSAFRTQGGELDHIDLLSGPSKLGVRITKDGSFISNSKPEFSYVTSYVYRLASHGWLLGNLLKHFTLLSGNNRQYGKNKKIDNYNQSSSDKSIGLLSD